MPLNPKPIKASRVKALDRDIKKWLDEEDRVLADDFYVSVRIRERAFKIYLGLKI